MPIKKEWLDRGHLDEKRDPNSSKSGRPGPRQKRTKRLMSPTKRKGGSPNRKGKVMCRKGEKEMICPAARKRKNKVTISRSEKPYTSEERRDSGASIKWKTATDQRREQSNDGEIC